MTVSAQHKRESRIRRHRRVRKQVQGTTERPRLAVFRSNKHISAQVYWGYRLNHVEVPDDSGGQGQGFNFRVNFNAF